MEKRPTYVVFAGVNGAGKSTFYHSSHWRSPDLDITMSRVNSDEILVQNKGDQASPTDQMKAGREALALLEENFRAQKSFNQETTLTGHSAVLNIKRAHSLGYRVILFYIGVASPTISLERIAHRVSLGGHNIDENDVRRRFNTSLRNFSNIIDFCDHVTVLDNTYEFKAVAKWTGGVLSWAGKISTYAPWLYEAVRDDKVWRAR